MGKPAPSIEERQAKILHDFMSHFGSALSAMFRGDKITECTIRLRSMTNNSILIECGRNDKLLYDWTGDRILEDDAEVFEGK